MRALSIRQPYAELILRGIKTVEYRTRPTRIVGERFWIYASRQWASGMPNAEGRVPNDPKRAWSLDLGMPDANAELPWMIELAMAMRLFSPEARRALPRGVIVGSAIIERVSSEAGSGYFRWHLAGIERLGRPRRAQRHPQPTWFRPF